MPTNQPTGFPSSQPSIYPSGQPSRIPSLQPTVLPSRQPTSQPSQQPTCIPSYQPSASPTRQPSMFPSSQPTKGPSGQPTSCPSEQPSSSPSGCPSRQPSNSPSKQPRSSPTSLPSNQPSGIPSAQPFAYPTSAPQATIYQTNGVLFYLGATAASYNSSTHGNAGILGSSYILFGRNFKRQNNFPFTINLAASSNLEFVSEISKSQGFGIRQDITIRSTTIVGDINGDGFLDLLIGYPLVSKCSVYLGDGVNDFATIISTTGESFAILGDPYQGGGFLGWSSIRIGDLNGDGFDEMVISAISANTVYVIYGKTHFDKIIHINDLIKSTNNGFQIKGSDQETNFGVGLALLHHFRKGSHADIAVTAQRASGGQCVVYVLFGGVLFKNPSSAPPGVIAIDQVVYNSSACLRIVAPLYSFAGFSVAGVGDVNSDGYDDLAIGSVPYYRGTFNEQKTYIIYGRKQKIENELVLTELSTKDGIIITGGGFLVTGVGDVNGDGVADVMISSYYDWKGQKSAYLISTPANMTYSPSLQPSSSPTRRNTLSTGNLPTRNGSSSDNSSTISSSLRPSFRPAFVSGGLNSTTRSPTRVVFAVGTARPSAAKPSFVPTLTPTSGYHHLRGFPTTAPIVPIATTWMPTINTTIFAEIDCLSSDKVYHGGNGTHNLFRITAQLGTVNLIGSSEGGAKNIYVLYCPTERVNVVIQNFRLSTDIISVAHLSKDGVSYSSLDKISYASKTGPLTLLFCSENKLQVILSSHAAFDLAEPNFLFTQTNGIATDNYKNKNTILARVQIGVVAGVFIFLVLVFSALSYQNKLAEKEKLKHEEKWFKDSLAELDNAIDCDDESVDNNQPQKQCDSNSSSSHSDENDSVSSKSTLVVLHNDELPTTNQLIETVQDGLSSLCLPSCVPSSLNKVQPGTLPQFDINNEISTLASMNSDEWEDALALSDDDDDDNDHENQQLPEQSALPLIVPSNIINGILLKEEEFQTHHRSSSSSSSSTNASDEEKSQFTISEIDSIKDDGIAETKNQEVSRTNLSINSDEWIDTLAFSDDGES
jgi:hypothetical protein